MRLNPFDQYQPNHSSIHQLDPRVKVLAAVLFIISTALLPDGAWLAYALSWALVIIITLLAHIEPWLVVKRSFLVLPFLLAAVTLLFTLPGSVLWQGPFGLRISDYGLLRFTSILLRSWISVQMAVLLTATTRFPDILHALRHLKVPAVLVSILAFMYRYLFVLTDEVGRMLRARAARSACLPGKKGGRSLLWRAKIAGHMVGQLFLRSIERSERVYEAMLARGYRGELLTMNPHFMLTKDWIGLVMSLLVVFAMQAAGRLI
ncbi:MAG: cobalt ECF transporter T component CbiQ [Candidatus Promineifilaceae bacterium]|nr:cobalt ECF transporter T component CbiQ [Candidatus Promineifilaceae bacterium]